MNSDHQNSAAQYSPAALNPATAMDGGSAGFAGATNRSASILGQTPKPLMYNDDRQDPPDAVSQDKEDGLPVLDDVIEPDDPIFSAWHAERARIHAEVTHAVGDPWQSGPDFERDILAHKLRTDLADGLEQMVSTAVSTAIERSVQNLEESLYTELLQSLGSRIDEALPRFDGDQSQKRQPTAPDGTPG